MKESIKVRFEVPPASAKRMEKNRILVVEGYSIGEMTYKKVYPIPDGINYVEFEHTDESLGPEYDDGNVYYKLYIEFKNETGSRVDQVEMFLD